MKRLVCILILLLYSSSGPAQQLSTEGVAQTLLALPSAAARESWLVKNPSYLTPALWAALHRRGINFLNLHQLDRALLAHTVALQVARLLRRNELIGESTHQLGCVERARNNTDQALQLFFAAQRLLVSSDPPTKRYALRLLKDLSLWFRSQGDFEKSQQYAQECLALAKELNDQQGIGIAYYLFGALHFKRSDYTAAIQDFEKSRQLLTESQDDAPYLLDVLMAEGEAHIFRAEYHQSQELYARAERLVRRLNFPYQQALFYYNYATFVGSQGNIEEMQQSLKRSLVISQQIAAQRLTAAALLNLGMSELYAGNYQRADDALREALETVEQLNNPPQMAFAQLQVGIVKMALEDYHSAKEYLTRALASYSRLGEKTKTATVISELARLFLKQNDFAKAAEYAEKAAAMGVELQNPELESFARAVAGEALLQQKQYAQSRRALMRAIELNELILAEIDRNPKSFANYFAETISPYWSLAALNFATGDFTASLLAAERGKGRALLEFLSRSTEQKEDQKIRERWAQDAAMTNIEELQHLLPDENTALLYYTCTPRAVYLFAVTRGADGLQIQPALIPVAEKELAAKIHFFRQHLATRYLNFRKEAQALFNLLMAPAAQALQGKTTICISPDGPLWELPFQALVDAQNKFLIESVALYRVPSLSVWRQLMARQSQPTIKGTERPQLLALGNPALEPQLAQQYTPLPEAVREVRAIAHLQPPSLSRFFTAAEASETRFKKEAVKYRYLHLAAHGVLDDAHPLDSRLILKRTATDDGMLRAREVMELPLTAELVVLSACDTARGKLSRGEGTIGMAWAFAIAGVPATVVSQWAVDSAATEALMVEFYQQLFHPDPHTGKTPGPAQALRNAQLQVAQRPAYREPYFWASFAVIGNGH